MFCNTHPEPAKTKNICHRATKDKFINHFWPALLNIKKPQLIFVEKYR